MHIVGRRHAGVRAPTYNHCMSSNQPTARHALIALACALPLLVLAQNQPPQEVLSGGQPTGQPSPPPQALPDPDKTPGARNQKIERIHVQDNNATIDELRVGGQTQSITVKPNSNAPAYNVMPNDTEKVRGQGQPDSSPSQSQRVWWDVFKF